MAIGDTFIFLKIVVDMREVNWKRIPEMRNAKKKLLEMELTGTYRYFLNRIMRLKCLSSTS